MVFKRPGNSRDDRSNRTPKRNTGGDDKAKRSANSRSSKTSFSENKQQGDRPKRNYRTAENNSEEKKSFSPRRKPYSGRPEGDERPKRSSGSYRGDGESSGERKFAGKPAFKGGDKKPGRGSFNPNFKREGDDKRGDRPFRKDVKREGDGSRNDKPFRKDFKRQGDDRPFRKRYNADNGERSFTNRERPKAPERVLRGRKKTVEKEDGGLIRLNRYISNAGICSRRKADELIAAGVISVNGEVVSELGHKVDPAKDVIRYNGETLKREKMVYVLLNKPKDYITTTDDPQERRTVMQLVEKASKERIYPVGRLDRNTTGLLLLTNDGDLADKLSHPKNNITKIYQVELSKSLTQGDLNKIAFGIELEDGFIKPDTISYVQGGTKKEVGIQIHSGKNRIVRRIFEQLGYEVVRLDRAVYANLTKKDLPRGRWRYLDEKEVIQLKHLI
ncbi:MAG: pseudouridine synthase [Mucilaginibacter sp.]